MLTTISYVITLVTLSIVYGETYHNQVTINQTFKLQENDEIYHISSGNRTKLKMQRDGNLVLYHTKLALWSTHTEQTTPKGDYTQLDLDGNLQVIGREQVTSVWESGTFGHYNGQPHILVVADTCAYIMDRDRNIFWNTDKSGWTKGHHDCSLYPLDLTIHPSNETQPVSSVFMTSIYGDGTKSATKQYINQSRINAIYDWGIASGSVTGNYNNTLYISVWDADKTNVPDDGTLNTFPSWLQPVACAPFVLNDNDYIIGYNIYDSVSFVHGIIFYTSLGCAYECFGEADTGERGGRIITNHGIVSYYYGVDDFWYLSGFKGYFGSIIDSLQLQFTQLPQGTDLSTADKLMCDMTSSPTSDPTEATLTPSTDPTSHPTSFPTLHPTDSTSFPTLHPTEETLTPSTDPTSPPTLFPTLHPTAQTLPPTMHPTSQPTIEPTSYPTVEPTSYPTIEPTLKPTLSPTSHPFIPPTSHPFIPPTSNPTLSPTSHPTLNPTHNPTLDPTFDPTSHPSLATLDPTSIPSKHPSFVPTTKTIEPSVHPTKHPIIPFQITLIVENVATTEFVSDNSYNSDVFNLFDGIHVLYMIIVFVGLFLCMCAVQIYLKKQRQQILRNDSAHHQIHKEFIKPVKVKKMQHLSFEDQVTKANIITCADESDDELDDQLDDEAIELETLNMDVEEAEDILMDDEMANVMRWLTEQVQLPQYYDCFIRNGYDNLEFIADIRDLGASELEQIGISKPGHKRRIFAQIKLLNSAMTDNEDLGELRVNLTAS